MLFFCGNGFLCLRLGFDYLSSVGLGMELDVSRYERWVTRVRLVARYRFGPNVQGMSIGFAVSF